VLDGLGLRIGVACVHAIVHTLDVHGLVKDVRLKWPNDVLIDGKKVSGILTETITHDGTRFLIVGVGINANNDTPVLPDDAPIKPVSLKDIIGHDVILPKLQEQLMSRLAHACSTTGIDQGTLADAQRYLFGVGTQIRATIAGHDAIMGTLAGINDAGELLCETPSGPQTLPRGAEVVWIGLQSNTGAPKP